MKCPCCKDELIRKEEHDTDIPLGTVRVFYCEAGKRFYGLLETYEEISMKDDE